MKVKVCGIRNKQNLDCLSKSEIDFVGFIFYEKSQRYFEEGTISVTDMHNFKKKKIGVFVNSEMNKIVSIINKYELSYVQLHGIESPETCLELKNKGFSVIKAFPVGHSLPENLSSYEGKVDYFLFDTKGNLHGGNGAQFNWDCLKNYSLKTPYFLSGGIGLNDVDRILEINLDNLIGVDINSQFEIKPGLKNDLKIRKFINRLKHKLITYGV